MGTGKIQEVADGDNRRQVVRDGDSQGEEVTDESPTSMEPSFF